MKNPGAEDRRVRQPVAAVLFASLLCCLPAHTGYTETFIRATDSEAGATTSFRGLEPSNSRIVTSSIVSVANAVRCLLRAHLKRRQWRRRARLSGSSQEIHTQSPMGRAMGPNPIGLPVHWVDTPCDFKVSPHYSAPGCARILQNEKCLERVGRSTKQKMERYHESKQS